MTISLRRKVLLREQAAAARRVARTAQAVGRTGQVARSTVPVADSDVPVVDVASDATEAAAAIPVVQDDVERAAADAYAAAVVVDEAMASASQAAADALLAKETADGKNRIFAQMVKPVAHPDIPFVAGDLWYETDSTGRFVNVWVWNATTEDFAQHRLVASSVLVPGTVGPVLIENGAITGQKLAADAVDGKTVTGATIRTAATGQRMQFDVSGLASYNASGVATSRLSAESGAFTIAGLTAGIYSSLNAAAVHLREEKASGVKASQLDQRALVISDDDSTSSFYRGISGVHPGSIYASCLVDYNGGTVTSEVSLGGGDTSADLRVKFGDAEGVIGTTDSGSPGTPYSFVRVNQIAAPGTPVQVTAAMEFGNIVEFQDEVMLQGDTEWANIPTGWLASGWTLSTYTPQWRIRLGYVEFAGMLVNNTFTGGYTTAFTVPLTLQNPYSASVFGCPVNSTVSRSWRILEGGTAMQAYSSATSSAWWPLNGIRYPLH